MGSVPHHAATLAVSPAMYDGLLDATAATLAATIPPERTDEAALWARMTEELRAQIAQSAL